MWEECEAIKKIVNPESLILHQNKTVALKEGENTAGLKTVKINNVNEQGITFRPCAGKDSLFTSDSMAGKRCDYVILSSKSKKKIALFIELKSKHQKRMKNIDYLEQIPHLGEDKKYPDAVYQLKASSCYFEYLHHVLKDFRGYSALSDEYPSATSRAFVIFHCKIIEPEIAGNITPTRPKTSKNNTPETALILKADNDQTFDFESLIL